MLPEMTLKKSKCTRDAFRDLLRNLEMSMVCMILAGRGVYQNLLFCVCFSAPYSLLHVYLYSKFELLLLF